MTSHVLASVTGNRPYRIRDGGRLGRWGRLLRHSFASGGQPLMMDSPYNDEIVSIPILPQNGIARNDLNRRILIRLPLSLEICGVESGPDEGSGVGECRFDLLQQVFLGCRRGVNVAKRGICSGKKRASERLFCYDDAMKPTLYRKSQRTTRTCPRYRGFLA